MIETKSASAEIYIYGDITPYDEFDSDTSAKSFVDELKNFDGEDITVHVNSPGGNCFEALAIHNALKSYGGNVTAQVDGLAASAASLIVCGADKIVMAKNALMMLHMPATIMNGFFNAKELTKARDMLIAIEDAIVDTYQSRLNRADSPLNAQIDLRAMLESETWLNARDALKWGFADEIAGAVDMQIDNSNKVLVVNSMRVDMKKFDEAKLRRALEAEKIMEIKTETTAQVVDVKEILQQERDRIGALMKLRGTHPIIDALVDVAIERGTTVAEFQGYYDAATNQINSSASVETSSAAEKFSAVIRDQMNSGAENVIGSQQVDLLSAQQAAILKYANGGKDNG